MRILIIKTSSLGDIVQAFPLLSVIKKHIPESVISWVVEERCSDLVASHPFVDECITVDTRQWKNPSLLLKSCPEIQKYVKKISEKKYNYLIDAQCNLKSFLLRSLASADTKIGFSSGWNKEPFSSSRFDIKVPHNPKGNIYYDYLKLTLPLVGKEANLTPSPLLHLNKEENSLLKEWTQRIHQRKGQQIMVCPGSRWENKRFSKPTLIEFLKEISNSKKVFFYFLWGTEEERKESLEFFKEFPKNSLSMEKVSIPLLQHLMSLMDQIISVDSFALHLSALTTTPAFAVFGPSQASRYLPPKVNTGTFQGTCIYDEEFTTRCSKLRKCPTGACMKLLTSQQLFDSYSIFSSKIQSE
jgi:heptosyltransferase I